MGWGGGGSLPGWPPCPAGKDGMKKKTLEINQSDDNQLISDRQNTGQTEDSNADFYEPLQANQSEITNSASKIASKLGSAAKQTEEYEYYKNIKDDIKPSNSQTRQSKVVIRGKNVLETNNSGGSLLSQPSATQL